MQKTQLSKIILSIIFIIVSGIIIFLRLYGLGNTPQGLTQDEAYYLYDAFSIHETGNDIHGQKSPLVFESTGEYKLNLPYLVSISTKSSQIL